MPMEGLIHLPADPQRELLAGFCHQAEELIRSAATPTEARLVRDQLCLKFEQECGSALLHRASREYIQQIITHRFGPENEQHPTNDTH